MKVARAVIFVLLTAAMPVPSVADADTNPLGKVFELIDALAAKIEKDGESEDKAYKAYFEWCDDTAANLANEIKTAKARKEKLEAKINEHSANIESATSKIEELAGAIASSEGQAKDASAIRKNEASDFSAAEAKLVDAIDTLDRAVSILSREMQKNSAAFTQIESASMSGLLQSLSVVIDAAAFSNNDKTKLVALVQQSADVEDGDPGAPAATAYKSHSNNIVEVLEDMKEKAEAQLSDLRQAEVKARHNYDMMKQSLEAQVAADTKDMAEEKAGKAADGEGKATAQGNLEGTVKALKTATEGLATTQANCMTTAADHEASMRSREEELKVIAEAKNVLRDTTSGAEGQTYSLLQSKSRTDLANSDVVTLVSRLAKKHHSAALAQLASRISAVVRFGAANGDDVFAKVRGLIQQLIGKLEREAASEATEKAYCDDEMAKSEAKKDELEDDIAKLITKLDQASASSAQLKEEVRATQAEVAELLKEQANMDRIRQEQHDEYVATKADLELGLRGVRKALGVLRDYYANKEGEEALLQDDTHFAALMQQPAMPESHKPAGGAGSSIIGILEVCEADFATGLSKVEAEESDSQSQYEKETQHNKIDKAEKEQAITYKTQQFKALDKNIAELSGDRESASTELSAVLEYYEKIKERCIAKPETYEARKARREAEVSGLRQALSILENDASFLQRKGSHGRRNFRGAIASL